MSVALLILILLMLLFGVGAVLEGVAWAALFAVAMAVVAAWFLTSKLRGRGH